MFDTMRRELSELMQRVKRATEWDTTIACGKVHLDEVSRKRSRNTEPTLNVSRS